MTTNVDRGLSTNKRIQPNQMTNKKTASMKHLSPGGGVLPSATSSLALCSLYTADGSALTWPEPMLADSSLARFRSAILSSSLLGCVSMYASRAATCVHKLQVSHASKQDAWKHTNFSQECGVCRVSWRTRLGWLVLLPPGLLAFYPPFQLEPPPGDEWEPCIILPLIIVTHHARKI